MMMMMTISVHNIYLSTPLWIDGILRPSLDGIQCRLFGHLSTQTYLLISRSYCVHEWIIWMQYWIIYGWIECRNRPTFIWLKIRTETNIKSRYCKNRLNIITKGTEFATKTGYHRTRQDVDENTLTLSRNDADFVTKFSRHQIAPLVTKKYWLQEKFKTPKAGCRRPSSEPTAQQIMLTPVTAKRAYRKGPHRPWNQWKQRPFYFAAFPCALAVSTVRTEWLMERHSNGKTLHTQK